MCTEMLRQHKCDSVLGHARTGLEYVVFQHERIRIISCTGEIDPPPRAPAPPPTPANFPRPPPESPPPPDQIIEPIAPPPHYYYYYPPYTPPQWPFFP
jgi:hypothetical protein